MKQEFHCWSYYFLISSMRLWSVHIAFYSVRALRLQGVAFGTYYKGRQGHFSFNSNNKPNQSLFKLLMPNGFPPIFLIQKHTPLSVQFTSVAQSCLTLCDPMDCSTPGQPVHHQLPEFTQNWLVSTESVMPYKHLILSCPLLLLPSIFPSIRVFSNESVLLIRWRKYWSFNISPSSEHSGLLSLRMDWLDLLAVQQTQKASPSP